MEKQITVLLVALSCLFSVSCKKDLSRAATNDLSPAKALLGIAADIKVDAKGLPFEGEYTTTFQMLQPPPMFVQKVIGKGNCTLFGKSSFVAIAHVNRSTPPPFVVTGTRTTTAANGDQIFSNFSGTSIPVATGINRTELVDVITGGTGRFSKARGTFSSSAIADVKNSMFTASFNGKIEF